MGCVWSFATRGFLVMVLVCPSLTACTYKVSAYKPEAERQFGSLPARAVIFIPGDPYSETTTKSGFFLLGMAHNWEFQTGIALENYSEEYFRTLFDAVSTSHNIFDMKQDREARLHVFPKINRFDVNQGLRSSLSLGCEIRTAEGDLLYQGQVVGETKSGGGATMGCLGGPFVGESVLQKSYSEALEDAFQRLVADIRLPPAWKRLRESLLVKETGQ